MRKLSLIAAALFVGSGTVIAFGTPNVLADELGPQVPSATLNIIAPANVPAGSELSYMLNYEVGGSQITQVVLNAQVPSDTTFKSASNNGVYDPITNVITWQLGDKAPGNDQITYSVTVASPLVNGTLLKVQATLDAANEGFQSIQANQETTVVSAPILTVEKIVSSKTAKPGDSILYSVKISNEGTDAAHNVKLNDTMASGLTVVDNGQTFWKANLGEIPAGESKATSYTVKVNADAPTGNYPNLATVTADNHAAVSAEAVVAVTRPAVLGVSTVTEPATPAQPASPEPAVGSTQGEVLGAETLAETGVGLGDWLMVYLAVMFIALGATTLRFYPFAERR